MENCDTSCEPMEVDLSANSINKSLIEPEHAASTTVINNNANASEYSSLAPEDESHTKPRVWNVKTFNIKLNKKKKNTPLGLYLTIFVVCMSTLLYFILEFKCSDDLDLKQLEVKLNNRLFGQNNAKYSLVEALEADYNSKILFLYGGTGVGKTFTTRIMLENYWNTSNVYHFIMPSFVNTFTSELLLGMHLCKSSIFVVDDIKIHDGDVKTKIQQVITKSENLNKKIIIILIYNCDVITNDLRKTCNISFSAELMKLYEDVNAYKKFIKFERLTQDILKQCIEKELGGVTVDLSSMLNNFDVSLDGCKGVHKKVKVLNLL